MVAFRAGKRIEVLKFESERKRSEVEVERSCPERRHQRSEVRRQDADGGPQ